MQNGLALARATTPARIDLPQSEKAAIIVQFLLSEGADLPLSDLPRDLQRILTGHLCNISMIDQATLSAVVHEFADALGSVGLAGPGSMDAALESLNAHLPPERIAELRKEVGMGDSEDVWGKISSQEIETLVQMVMDEAVEVAAVILSKIEVAQAARVLRALPFDDAQQICMAVSMTENVTPRAVTRIGETLFERLEARPEKAFEALPAERMGAILNIAANDLREQMIEGLEAVDEAYASGIKSNLFIFADIPSRVVAREIPKLMRFVPLEAMGRALAYAADGHAVEAGDFILTSLPKRMGEQLREQMEKAGSVDQETGEGAMSEVVAAILTAANQGEITLLARS